MWYHIAMSERLIGNVTTESLPERTATFNYMISDKFVNLRDDGKYLPALQIFSATERQGLEQLAKTLDMLADHTPRVSLRKSKASPRAHSIEYIDDLKQKLFFVGEPELQVGVAGIAKLWRDFLRADRDHQIILPESHYSPRQNAARSKSQTYVLSHVLDHIPAEEQERIALADLDTDMTIDSLDPEGTKIAFVDDWVVTQGQMLESVQYAMTGRTELKKFVGAATVDLIVAAEGMERVVYSQADDFYTVPITSQFRAKRSRFDSRLPLFAGTHSSSDFGFVGTLSYVGGQAKRLPVPPTMPWLANIVRGYGLEPWRNVTEKLRVLDNQNSPE
jgi:hypothetical protein